MKNHVTFPEQEELEAIRNSQNRYYQDIVIPREINVPKKNAFNEYQNTAFTTAVYPNKGNNLTYPVLGLGEEAGEVLGKLKKMMRDDGGVLSEERRQAFKKELGDVLWYVAATATELGFTLEEVVEANLEKLFGRRERGTLHGSGDDR